jgi:hypothetical protein
MIDKNLNSIDHPFSEGKGLVRAADLKLLDPA